MSLDPRTVEQRLVDAFRHADRVEPTEDLWTRVVHSIDEDRAHRRRVFVAATTCLGMLVVLVAAALPFRRHDLLGTSIDPVALAVLETVALATIVVVLGPAIRRFGRGYTRDLWPSNPAMASSILRLLDVAYFLVFVGYILLTTELQRFDAALSPSRRDHLADQLASGSIRIGGMLLLIGVLHAMTMLLMPFVALVDNSTRRGRRLPRWLAIAGAVLLVTLSVPLLPLLVSLLIGVGS